MCFGQCAVKADMLVQNNSASSMLRSKREEAKHQSLTYSLRKVDTGMASSQEAAVLVC